MIRIALTQIHSSMDKESNLEKLRKYTEIAASNGADLIVFPEYFMFYSNDKKYLNENAEPINGIWVKNVIKIFNENSISGIVCINELNDNNVFDTAVYISGDVKGYYRKKMLYDAFGYRESDIYKSGNGPFNLYRINDISFGILICYEIRFPELFRNYSKNGADMIIIPSGWFSGPVKEEQWLSLLRARALENTVYIASSNQIYGDFTGISAVADPIGIISERAGESETMIFYDVKKERINDVRQKMPLLEQLNNLR
ncbi:carbon-nitrogen hydrolase family protein [Picrophilus oshimae]|uniref:Carbon-nitrogen hydrolase family n=1 Tax=Picrophilus torridus (strain ATCC 700027 / DSM 9790 / JCM 10055 / NBRC 100828 / KAW 2/3) TaxID=1122961 RepID=Q6L0F7_PICTO|nr:carbon-nitrogen hydrolase family protein [Picrophilus oshimae]AAT43545.1 carbon-nitrogen hydrolase family [Picrophilus oshimae DSM 9789]SMD30142.1 Predicted amidohydrolase [Picrophilus oshimae DSM 9789]